MQITEIVVHAGRTVNHPLESYSNLKPSLSLKATLGPDDDVIACLKQLQAQAETLIEEHKHRMIADIVALDGRMKLHADLASSERELQRLQSRIESLKNGTRKLDDKAPF